MTTPLQLIELTRPDHILLQRLLREAPGTYQHSLQVANLAEQAAECIGADTLLTRVGALYHDIGKMTNPTCFIENQMQGFANPHEGLDPETSAALIIRHVTDGLSLARQYRLPVRIRDFITEHHGTTLTRFQYTIAVNAAGGDAGQVNREHFRYPGPRPQSRETAILMLADACEARFRADRPKDEEALRKLIRDVLAERMSMGELNETKLTLSDLDQITESFVMTLRGIYHPRIQYPQQLPQPEGQVSAPPLLASVSPEVPEKTSAQPTDLPGSKNITVPRRSKSESLSEITQSEITQSEITQRKN
jgi:hypothetical protein